MELNVGTIVTLVLVVVALALVIRSLLKKRSGCDGCDGGCSSDGCGGCSAAEQMVADMNKAESKTKISQ